MSRLGARVVRTGVMCVWLSLAGCSGQQGSLAASPTPTAPVAPTTVMTPTPLLRPTPICGTAIDAAYLERAAKDIVSAVERGTAQINNAASSCTPQRFGIGHVVQCWNQPVTFTDLLADPVLTIKFMVALGAFHGTEGAFYPARQDHQIVFAAIDGLAFARLTLTQAPAWPAQADMAVAPRGLVIRPRAELTIIGLLAADDSGGAPRALVAVSDPSRTGWLATRHYLAVLPVEPAAGDAPDFTLTGLLSLNGARYDDAQSAVELMVGGDPVSVQLNRITDEALSGTLIRAAGLAFVDELGGAPAAEPLIPYPEIDLPVDWALKPQTAGRDDVLELRGATAANGPKGTVHFDAGKLAWVWGPAE